MSRERSLSLYGLASGLSYIIRGVACYFTIGQVDLFENEFLNFIVPDIFIYVFIMLASRLTVKAIVYNRMGNEDKSVGCFSHFIAYFPYMFLMWLILSILTWVNVLPIAL